MMFLILIWVGVHVAILALFLRRKYSRFSDFNVKCKKIVPIFGNLLRLLLRIDNFTDDLDRNYKDFKDERFVGRYEFWKPVLMIRDLNLAKKIAIKDFEYFIDHRTVVSEKHEPLFARNLISLKGQEWKDMRSTLSPAFTSSKIKLMVPFMEEVGEQMIRAMIKKIKENNGEYVDVDCKDLTTRYTNDVIASCAFGIKVDSHTEENNEFYKMGKAASTFTFKQILVTILGSSFPRLAKALNLSMFPKSTKDFFMEVVLNTMKDREAHNIFRPDMIHLLMEAKKGQLKHDEKESQSNDTGFATVEESDIGKKSIDKVWSDMDLVAQAVLFYIAGFDTISTAMSFALHELALHPDVQDRLVQEIKDHHDKNDGKLDFNTLSSMVYMDMVTSEVLRLWPPGLAIDRICVKDYNLGKPNKEATKDYIIQKGEILAIPVWCFHHDPQYFENPQKFDPERFSDENKKKINSLAYMPFGIGPRNCIGSRFALCELKMLLYRILLHMEISPCPKTCLSGRLSNTLSVQLEGGHWLRFKLRK